MCPHTGGQTGRYTFNINITSAFLLYRGGLLSARRKKYFLDLPLTMRAAAKAAVRLCIKKLAPRAKKPHIRDHALGSVF
jgi:hypothetical protein